MTNIRERPNDHRSGMQKASREREEEKVRILAARLRITTDAKLNKTTPAWVKELAGRNL